MSFSCAATVPRIRVPRAASAGSPNIRPAVSNRSPLMFGRASQSAKFANQPPPISIFAGKAMIFRIFFSCRKAIFPPVTFSRISRQSSSAPPAIFQYPAPSSQPPSSGSVSR